MRPGKGGKSSARLSEMNEIVAGQLDAANTTSFDHDVDHVIRSYTIKFISILHDTTKV